MFFFFVVGQRVQFKECFPFSTEWGEGAQFSSCLGKGANSSFSPFNTEGRNLCGIFLFPEVVCFRMVFIFCKRDIFFLLKYMCVNVYLCF